MRLGRYTAAAVAAALLLTTPTAAGAQSATEADPAVIACDGHTSTELGTVLPYRGFEMDFQNASVDESGHVLLEMLITNATGRGDMWATGLGAQNIEWDGAYYPADFTSTVTMPEGLPVRASMDAGPFPEGFSLCDAVLVFGRPDEHQSSLPLAAGAQAVYPTPVETAFAKKKHTRNKKKLAQATLVDATVYPTLCTADGWGDVAEVDRAGILLSVDQRLKAANLYNSAALVDPNGEEWEATNGRDWIDGSGKRREDFCFNVDAPVGGKYKLRLSYGDKGIQIPFNLPPVDFYAATADEAATSGDETPVDEAAPEDEPVDDTSDEEWDGDGEDPDDGSEPSGIEA